MLKLATRIAVLALIIPVLGVASDIPRKGSPAFEHLVGTLFSVRQFEQTAISPDGKQVAWVESLVDKNGVPNGNSVIYLSASVPGAKARRITAGSGSADFAEQGIAWSPDGRRLAFLSDAAAGQQQLYVADVSAGSARRLTDIAGFLQSPGWSPDGKTLAVLFTENATRAAGPLVAETPQTGVIKDAVTEQRLALVDASGGKLRQISPADMYVYEYDWSPDGKRFVTTAAHGNGDNNWYIAQLYTLDAAGGDMKSIYKPPLQIAGPAWSPDGKSVAFIAGLMSDEPSVGGDIFVVPAEGGEARNVTQEMKASASWLTWTHGGKIKFGEWIDGGSAIATVDPNGGQPEVLWRTDDQITAGGWGVQVSLSADEKTASVIRQSFSRPPEVWAGPLVTICKAGCSILGISMLRASIRWWSAYTADPARWRMRRGLGRIALPCLFPEPTISCSSPIRAAASAGARPSPEPTSRISVTAIGATFWREWMQPNSRPRLMIIAWDSPDGATAVT
jgi:Tol biopolymer transport system component